MSRKKDDKDKPVNISISFNIAPNEIIKSGIKCDAIQGRKIRNVETLKSHRDSRDHRDTPVHYPFV